MQDVELFINDVNGTATPNGLIFITKESDSLIINSLPMENEFMNLVHIPNIFCMKI